MKAAHFSKRQEAWINKHQKEFYSMARKYVDGMIEAEKRNPKVPPKQEEQATPFERMIRRRDELIKRATPAEVEFYSLMDSVGLSYEKQYQLRIGGFLYFADAFFVGQQLVFEIDGKYHNTEQQKRKDAFRTRKLEQSGFSVIRVTNKDVYNKVYIFELLEKHGIKIDAYKYTKLKHYEKISQWKEF